MRIKDKQEREDTAKRIISILNDKLRLSEAQHKHKRSGAINIKTLNKQLCQNSGKIINSRLFDLNKRTQQEHDVLILLDSSGSMSNDLGISTRINEAVSSIYTLAYLLNELKINYSVYGFCTQTRKGEQTYLREIKPADKTYSNKEIFNKLDSYQLIDEYCENNDAAALIGAAEILKKSGRAKNKKLLILLSDGLPEAPIKLNNGSIDKDNSLLMEATIQAINRINKEGIKTLALSLSNEANRYLREAPFNKQVLLNDETRNKGLSKALADAYLKAVGL